MTEHKIVNGVNFNATWVKTLKVKEFVKWCVDNNVLSEEQAKEAYEILVKK
jgi:hypothetical protein